MVETILMPQYFSFRIAILFLLAFAAVIPAVSQARRTTTAVEAANKNGRPSPTPPAPADTSGAVDEGEVVSVETDLVSIPVRVLDKKGRFIGGLSRENFRVLEDGIEQPIEYFTNEAQPFTVALVLDMSYSTTFKISEIQVAAIEFVQQLRPADRVLVAVFDKDVRVLAEATNDREKIYKAINLAKIATGTSLYEAVDLMINDRLMKVKGRKAMVLFTDGVDTTSESSHDVENLRDALESEVLIYPIRYDTFADVQKIKNAPPTAGVPGGPPSIPGQRDPSGLPFPIPQIGIADSKGTSREEYAAAEAYLDQLAERTGGRVYVASTFGNLTDAFKKIASELREFYSIGYSPKDDGRRGKLRKLKVTTDQENVIVRSRTSYVFGRKKDARPGVR